ncbi:3',5'-cyclic-nucleotide phosphodiesterase [Sphingomonas sanguinis]|uniref:MBL fold metallo-hydrolase n=1 Tax=Sphingomonas sp. LC-1 TaxID=3110957 RepID=UPI0021BA4134|nr:3',5'-cyclic-nucleotide phosphodiesterase [Sphingomonas sp. LC-1]MCT8002346.1 3',5'-cyclic-nucleotide phosphodiesterase [Sphingomonas sp. LC-1]
MKRVLLAMTLVALALPGPATGARSRQAFDIVPLGVKGGLEEGETTAWYIASAGSRRGVACDAGTLVPGIRAGIRAGAFGRGAKVADVLHDRIGAYLITHAHLDHVAGLVMASPDDTAKPIFALPAVNAALAADYFNGSAWPNMADRGPAPRLNRYTYRDLVPGAPPVPIAGTGLNVSAFPLSHGGTVSTAFLIRSGADAILCMGDTGPDAVERSGALALLWTAVAPLIREGRLRAIIVETSYPDPRPDGQLFGHLTPRWLHSELSRLADVAGSLAGVPIVIGHIKPDLSGSDTVERRVMAQLAEPGGPEAHYIQAQQGQALHF